MYYYVAHFEVSEYGDGVGGAELAYYERNVEAAARMAERALGQGGDEPPVPEQAAWTVVANVLMNLDEFLVKY